MHGNDGSSNYEDVHLTADLLYELASPSRCAILYELLRRGEARLSDVARVLNMSMQEAHRNMTRLVDAGLAAKNTNGRFMLTEYGILAARQLDYFMFIAKHRDLLRSYNVAGVPSMFINRLSELANCRVVLGVSAVLEKLKALEAGAEEYINIIVAQAWYEEGSILIDRLSNGISVRMIFTSSTIVPKEIIDSDIPKVMRGFKIKGTLDTRLVDGVGAAVYISERQAGLMLPNPSGIFDMNMLLLSDDRRFHTWCNDLFMHYWSRADEVRHGIEGVVKIVE
ncbi:MAG: helix-turn-helix domain-containing protein [Candidatus Nitrosocaldus sp.]|nr:helix-turn-helix domain-containing protein [Candidatus Nitrosocaldus sp.]MDW8275784.1 helix-turn-helix domain-containing protein [Candidatus Nitrosocaldus sp.]